MTFFQESHIYILKERKMTIYIHQISVSKGGVPKLPVDTAEVTANGLVGDKQNDTANHGGPERAVSLFSLDVIQALQSEGHTITPGATGENITLAGLSVDDWPLLQSGSQLKIGDTVELEITRPVSPCKKIGDSFINKNFTRISEKVHPGWSRLYAKVLTPGQIGTGDAVRINYLHRGETKVME
jgi:MOSC domain-containing protein YiiM